MTIGCRKCGYISCVCAIIEAHHPKCKYLVAATTPVGIECEHGFDVCPICDPCNCNEVSTAIEAIEEPS